MHNRLELSLRINLLRLNTDFNATSAAFTDSSNVEFFLIKLSSVGSQIITPIMFIDGSKGQLAGPLAPVVLGSTIYKISGTISLLQTHPSSSQLAAKAREKGKKSTKIS